MTARSKITMYLAFYQRHPFLGGLTRSLVKYLGITLGWSKRQGWVSNSKLAYKPSSPSIAIYGHTTMKIQLPVRSAKSNIVGCDQYCRGRPGEKPACCSSYFFGLKKTRVGLGLVNFWLDLGKDKGGFVERQGRFPPRPWTKKTRAVLPRPWTSTSTMDLKKDKGGFEKVG